MNMYTAYNNHFHDLRILITEVLHMAYFIKDTCISCGACEPECPTSAISEGDDQYIIDPDACIDCGACAEVCPVDAPEEEA